MDGHAVLLIGLEAASLQTVSGILQGKSSSLFYATKREEAFEHLEQRSYSMILCRVESAENDGLSILCALREKSPQSKIIFLSDEVGCLGESSTGLGLTSLIFKTDVQSEVLQQAVDFALQEPEVNVASIEFFDVFLLMTLSKRPHRIEFIKGGNRGVVFSENKRILWVQARNMIGIPAFFEILSWQHGFYRSLESLEAPEANVFTNTDALLKQVLAGTLDLAHQRAMRSEQALHEQAKQRFDLERQLAKLKRIRERQTSRGLLNWGESLLKIKPDSPLEGVLLVDRDGQKKWTQERFSENRLESLERSCLGLDIVGGWCSQNLQYILLESEDGMVGFSPLAGNGYLIFLFKPFVSFGGALRHLLATLKNLGF